MDLDKALEQYGREIEGELDVFFNEKIREADRYHEFVGAVYQALRDYVLRKGKRLASCSTLMVYRGYGGDIDERILKVCVGIELYRHGILVHDDLVDGDDLRRGGEAVHKIFADVSEAFGNGVAVFTGNILYALSLEMVLGSGFSRGPVQEVVSLMNADYSAVNESQILDNLFEHREPGVEEWYKMASKRASSLFRTNMLAGAVLAGAPSIERKALVEIAANIGYAFDIQDDIIGTFAAEEDYGRPTTRDVISGKKPLHVVYAFQRAPPGGLGVLRSILGDREAGEKDIATAKGIIAEYGLEPAKERSREHAHRAVALLNKTNMNQEAKGFFIDFIGYITESLSWYK